MKVTKNYVFNLGRKLVNLEPQEYLASLGFSMKKAYHLGYSKRELKVHREEGQSGEYINRPMMNELREDIANGIINKVIISLTV